MTDNFWTIIGTAVTFLGLIYAILRNFKTDVKSQIISLEGRIISIEERIFFLASGKTLREAIQEEKKKEMEEK